ncbi:hypothetical protein E4T56_gene3603 [Termitomyces sp. T112]|nr:hypothetical protein E4T56_gene3603 [Termitomyces sp. T112]
MEVFLCKQVEVLMVALTAWEGELQRAREDRDAAQAEKEALEWAWNTSVRVVLEQVLEVWGLQEHPTQWGVQLTEEAEEQKMAPEGGPLWAELEVARQREDWLANKAASGWAGTDARGSASRVAAGDGEGGEVAGGTLTA